MITNNCKSLMFDKTACTFPEVPILDFAQSMGILNTFVAKSLKKPISQCKVCSCDSIII